MNNRKRRRGAHSTIAALGVAMMLCSCGALRGAAPAPGTAGRVIALNHISVLRSLFNHDQGHARLVLIFSPT